MSGTRKKEEAMLYYLYMMSDGEISYSEEKLFNEICRNLNLDEDDKQTAIERCKEIAESPKAALDVIIGEKLDDLVAQGWFGMKNASDLASIVWNLVNLGYADKCYSEEEKAIVNYLLLRWNIDEVVYQEMIDTADTILALTRQKEWVVSTFAPGSERDEKEKRVDTEISTLFADIKLSIAELTM